MTASAPLASMMVVSAPVTYVSASAPPVCIAALEPSAFMSSITFEDKISQSIEKEPSGIHHKQTEIKPRMKILMFPDYGIDNSDEDKGEEEEEKDNVKEEEEEEKARKEEQEKGTKVLANEDCLDDSGCCSLQSEQELSRVNIYSDSGPQTLLSDTLQVNTSDQEISTQTKSDRDTLEISSLTKSDRDTQEISSTTKSDRDTQDISTLTKSDRATLEISSLTKSDIVTKQNPVNKRLSLFVCPSSLDESDSDDDDDDDNVTEEEEDDDDWDNSPAGPLSSFNIDDINADFNCISGLNFNYFLMIQSVSVIRDHTTLSVYLNIMQD